MQRVILLLLGVLISIPFFFRNRESAVKPPHAPFSALSSNRVIVQVIGAVQHPGIYRVSANIMAHDVIKMAGLGVGAVLSDEAAMGRRLLKNGDSINLELKRGGRGIIRSGSIPSAERMVLGIPLDINEMSEADFDRLDAIGPVMARRIVEYRHKNGGTMRVNDLLSVEGMGENKYKKIKTYF